MRCRHSSSPERGFTLIELLVVIGIIVLLISILVPVVSRVRLQSYNASTQAQMQRIFQACESYYHDFNAYPGPVGNIYLYGGSKPSNPVPISGAGLTGPITSSENLVLGLLGFLTPPPAGTSTITFLPAPGNATITVPHDVCNLSPIHPGVPSYHYIDYVPNELSAGLVQSTAAMNTVPARDTIVPEFIDRFPDPLPILYLRANVGATGTPQVHQQDLSAGQLVQYNYTELSAYGCNVQAPGPNLMYLDPGYFQTMSVFVSSSKLADNIATPYADWNGKTPAPGSTTYNGYLTNPNIPGPNPSTAGGIPRGKDGFILIGAGIDRTYGTSDDIILTP